MKFDFLADPALAERFAVVNAETGEPIEDVAWADDEAGAYATISRELADATGTGVTRIGVIDAEPGVRFVGADGRPIAVKAGYQHFAERR